MVRQLVERVQRRRDADFNPEGPEGDDCVWDSGYYNGDEGEFLVAIAERTEELLGCAAVTVGTAVSFRTSGMSESEDAVAAIRRVCVDFTAVPPGMGRRDTLLRALLEEAKGFAKRRGGQRVIALGYEGGRGCQPTPRLLRKMGYVEGDPLPGCPGVTQHVSFAKSGVWVHPAAATGTRTDAEVAVSVEETPPCSSFAGQWKMDLQSSDSLRKVLSALGMNFILIQIVDRLGVEQKIAQSDDALKVQVQTALGTDMFELPFDGAVTSVPGATGGTNKQTSAWVEAPMGGPMRLRTVQAVKGALENPGESVLFETVRSLGDQDSTLFEDVTVLNRGVRIASARRVLRRRSE